MISAEGSSSDFAEKDRINAAEKLKELSILIQSFEISTYCALLKLVYFEISTESCLEISLFLIMCGC